MGKLRRMASEFQGQFQEAMREAELADLKKQVDDMTSQAQSYANFDPVSDVRKEFESTSAADRERDHRQTAARRAGHTCCVGAGTNPESGALSGPAAVETAPAARVEHRRAGRPVA